MNAHASEALEAAVRESRAQFVGYLASRADGDLAAAEDALSEAILDAVRQWPARGIPAKPAAWLLTVARRRLLDGQRRQAVRERSGDLVRQTFDPGPQTVSDEAEFPDERLKLLFVCAHPAIDEASRTPLMLQVILGIDARSIASAFLVAPEAMAQRLVRAKAKIKAARIPFAVPEPESLPERLGYVLDAIYAAFTQGSPQALTHEALRLAELTHKLVPESAEATGLLSLILHSSARARARSDDDGRYVPLDEQDCSRWDHAAIDRAELLLAEAAAMNQPGRFQLEAAIHSAHAERRITGGVNWLAIVAIYEALLKITPAIGARIGHAVAVAHVSGPAQGLDLLARIDEDRTANHQPFWAAKARLLADAGRSAEAGAAYERAIGLCEDPAARAHLMARREAITRGGNLHHSSATPPGGQFGGQH